MNSRSCLLTFRGKVEAVHFAVLLKEVSHLLRPLHTPHKLRGPHAPGLQTFTAQPVQPVLCGVLRGCRVHHKAGGATELTICGGMRLKYTTPARWATFKDILHAITSVRNDGSQVLEIMVELVSQGNMDRRNSPL
jgi:hypothetical protein